MDLREVVSSGPATRSRSPRPWATPFPSSEPHTRNFLHARGDYAPFGAGPRRASCARAHLHPPPVHQRLPFLKLSPVAPGPGVLAPRAYRRLASRPSWSCLASSCSFDGRPLWLPRNWRSCSFDTCAPRQRERWSCRCRRRRRRCARRPMPVARASSSETRGSTSRTLSRRVRSRPWVRASAPARSTAARRRHPTKTRRRL
mmetsp:Transcript_17128/g.40166  ORF Transcript_17128/g.40166 Transcript_17128/m.40166 type:complete len:201 (-) Transcript_17128:510-1112(-)